MPLPPDIKRTYFENRLAEGELDRLLAERNAFVLENVAAVDATAAACQDRLAALDLRCRVDDWRRSATSELAPFLAWPIALAMAVRVMLQTWAHRRRHPDPDVVIIKRAQALDVRYRKPGR